MVLQNVILPCAYFFWRIVFWGKPLNRIILADAHHDSLPYSMENIYRMLKSRGYAVDLEISNYSGMTAFQSFGYALRFMKCYARARYVFICDNFLPVASCHKNKKTTVVQLWHSCGLLKKMGYDAQEDIPKRYLGKVYKNYDLVTVSAPCCVEPLANAMHLPQGIVKPLGVSRTDNYFDPAWQAGCIEEFYEKYPALRHKKLILWAPTFRGNAGDPYQIGMEEISRLEKSLPEAYFIIRKVHPYVDAKYHLSNCEIQTERLFPVVDVLISDYSSVVCEFMAFHKPYVMFAPDLDQFLEKRGFYVPYESLSPYIATDVEGLCACVQKALNDTAPDWVQERCGYHLGSCDGKSTGRILDYLGLQEVRSDG